MASIFDKFSPALVTLEDDDGNIIKVDATISEGHALEAQATKHEVESGAEISDHVINRGVTLTLRGIISDNPIRLQTSVIDTTIGAAAGQVGGVSGAILGGVGIASINNFLAGSDKPSLDAFQILQEAYINKSAFTIVTGLSVYSGMIMERLNAPRSSKTAHSLDFTAKFRQVNIVFSDIVLIPLTSLADGTAKGASDTKSLGKKELQDATEETESSILRQLSDKTGFTELLQ